MKRQMTNDFSDIEFDPNGEEISQSVIEFANILTILHSSIVSTLANGEHTANIRQIDGNSPNERQLAMKEKE